MGNGCGLRNQKPGIGGLTDGILAGRRIIIGTNGATSLLESLPHALPRGNAVTSDPTCHIFTNFLERCGYQTLAVPEDHEGILM